jgi:DNA ligase-1
MTFRPMLASHCKDTSKLKFPVLASKKLDGVRASMQGGILLSRSLKPIPNVHVQEMFKGLPEGLDGELIFGDPCSPTAYRDTVSIVMSDDKPADGINLHVFDKFEEKNFSTRIRHAGDAVGGRLTMNDNHLRFVQHILINSIEELDAFEAAALAEGQEGVMIRSLDGPYKQGRSTEKEAYLLKLKRFCDTEAVVTGTYELQHNANDSFVNELGRTARSTEKAGKAGLDTLGGFYVTGVGGDFDGVEFKVGNGQGMTQDLRKQLWIERDTLIGRIIKVKYFPTGSKDRPRHPLWLGWRDARDL